MKPSKLLLLAVSLAAVGAAVRAEIIERVIARVNGDVVTLSEFEARQLAAVQQARIAPSEIERFLRENNSRLLQDAVDDMLILQRGAELGIKLRPEYVDEVIEGIKKENNIADEGELRRQLRREGMSLEELRRNVERSVIRRQVLSRDLEAKAAVSEAEVRAEYERQKATFVRRAGVRLHEIVVPDAETARSLAARARGGEDFAALARAHSTAPSRDSGGDLGRLLRGEMNPQLEAAAFALPEGGVSEPIPTESGYRIIRATERQEEAVAPFDEVKVQITQRLGADKVGKLYDEYVAGLRKHAKVHTMVNEVPLSVDLPAAGTTTVLPADATAGSPPEDAEIVVTPQARPERVAPAAPAAPAPTPTPPPL